MGSGGVGGGMIVRYWSVRTIDIHVLQGSKLSTPNHKINVCEHHTIHLLASKCKQIHSEIMANACWVGVFWSSYCYISGMYSALEKGRYSRDPNNKTFK